jgi:hypothetical protein
MASKVKGGQFHLYATIQITGENVLCYHRLFDLIPRREVGVALGTQLMFVFPLLPELWTALSASISKCSRRMFRHLG